MYTTAATFAAKIKTLQDYHARLLNGTFPLPTGFDIANTLSSLKQSLQVVLKDMPSNILEMTKYIDKDSARLSLFPAMDYKGLYNALVLLIDDAAIIHIGFQEFGQSVFCTMIYLIPFLERDLLSSLPYIAASSLTQFPVEMHREIMNYIIYHILSFTVPAKYNEDSYIALSIPSVLMTVLQYSEEICQSSNVNAHHCHLLECLMALKPNLAKDILNIIAYGPSYTRVSASKLLFYYWPSFNTALFERRAAPAEINETIPYSCQNKFCSSGGNSNVSKVCNNILISIKYSIGSPPPLYLCIECANEIHREYPNQEFHDVLLPVHQASTSCDYKNCRGVEKNVVSMCFSMECATYNGNRPIRYCQSCHNSRHNSVRGYDHTYHTKLSQVWEMDPVMGTYLIDAAVSLLKEARPVTPEIPRDFTDIQAKAAAFNVISESSSISLEERQLMGRFGALLLIGLCMPVQDTPQEVVGRMLSILFNWFRITAYTFDKLRDINCIKNVKKSFVSYTSASLKDMDVDHQEEYSLENLKKFTISKRLLDIHNSHFPVYISCLLPHPANYARVGGHWELLVPHTSHLKNGLNKIYCLTQYNLITQEVWDLVMPHWLEAIVQDVSEKELAELKMAISKMLDINQCTIANFDAKKMYHFIAIRFKRTAAEVQGQALSWLQVLTLLDITLPIHMLFSFFEDGINSLIETESEYDDFIKQLNIPSKSSISPVVDRYEEIAAGLSDDEGKKYRRNIGREKPSENLLKLQCCVLMLDVILKQMGLHNIENYIGIHSVMAQDIARLLHKTLSASWFMNHICPPKEDCPDCPLCEACTIWHQLGTMLIEYVCPEDLAHPPDPPLEDSSEDSKRSPPDSDKKEQKGDSLNSPFMEINTIMTATVETVVEQLDLAPIILTERIIPTIARAITLPDPEIGNVRASRPNIFSDFMCEHHNENECEGCTEDVWNTSVGKFRFSLEELPPQLQYFHMLLKEVARIENPSILYSMLESLYLLVLHGDILSKSVKDHPGFVIWCQENLIIKNMWELCNAEHSHLCEVCVPILLHCVTLLSGSDVFWKILQEEFHSSDWRARFVAVERVTVMARFMDATPLRSNFPLQSVLTNAFCYLISSIDDYSEIVAQRATLYLGTIHDYAMKSLIMCLETQFDSVIVDRPVVLQSLYQLHNSLSDRKILTWEFFLNRFDTLFIEAQIHLEKTGDIPHFRDLRNFDQTNESFVKKLQRAQEALSQTSDSTLVKTLSASFGTKWPYKRTMSAPASMLSRQDSKLEKDKVYNRQFSAPVLKRKSSRFGLEAYNQQCINSADDSSNVYATLHRIIALEETDRETTHLLVFLLMQFLSRSDQATPCEEKGSAKIQKIVLRHLYLLLGYNQNERGFHVAPHVLRTSAVFNAFLSNLPQLLDQNYEMGVMIVPTTLLLLQYCPCPPHNIILDHQNNPIYSLWHLETHIRRCWIMSLFVFLYKYNYCKPPISNQVVNLIKIVLNTLNAEHHVCHRTPAHVIMTTSAQPTYSRDLSQRSIGAETPPQSPGNIGHTAFRGKKSATSMETHWEEEPASGKNSQSNSYSTEAEDGEIACPVTVERCKSDSNVPESSSAFFEDGDARVCEYAHKNENFRKPVWYLGNEDQVRLSTSLCPYANITAYSHSSTESFSPVPTVTCAAKSPRNSVMDEGIVIYDLPSDQEGTFLHVKDANNASHSTGPVSSVYIPETLENCTDVAKKSEDIYGSPESPLSKMNAHLNSDYTGNRKWTASNVEFTNTKELALPVLERLLPVGKSPHRICDDSGTCSNTSTVPLEVKRIQEKRPKLFADPSSFPHNYRLSNIDRIELQSKSRSISPRRLMKQVALESPSDDVFIKSTLHAESAHQHHKNRKFGGNVPSSPHALLDYMQQHGFWSGIVQRGSSIDPNLEQACHASFNLKQSSYRVGEDCTAERCSECGMIREEYNDDEIGLCLIVIGTFVHREPALAAPILHHILSIIAKLSVIPMYSWQMESNVNMPGSSGRVAKQFLKVILQQLAPNGVFVQMFRIPVQDCSGVNFFKCIVQALTDFKELCPITPLMMLFEVMNNKKSLPLDRLPVILKNMASYIECILMDNVPVVWGPFLAQAEIFFRRITLVMSTFESFAPFLKNIICILRIPGIVMFKNVLDPFSKILTYGIENFTLNYRMLLEVCYHCNRAFARERDKLMLTRVVVFELVQTLKSKSVLSESNILTLINFILQDMGGTLPIPSTIEGLLFGENFELTAPVLNTGAAEVMRQNFTDALDFVADFHSLTKIKANYKCSLIDLHEDTLGGTLKAGMSQYIALELTRGTSRDNRVLARYFPWFCVTPAAQQATKEFIDCACHVRLLTWLLVGTLTNNCFCGSLCQSVPQEVSCYVADHVQVVLVNFPYYAKTSVVHMSALFHSFVLCQLWTIYLEHLASSHVPNSEPYVLTMSILFDFWGKVTPAILKLISHSKIISDMVNLHFISVIETLLECRSLSLSKLLPIWRPILNNENAQLPGYLLMRLQNCQNFFPSMSVTIANVNVTNSIQLKWLQRLQFKMGQIELQASQPTQFCTM